MLLTCGVNSTRAPILNPLGRSFIEASSLPTLPPNSSVAVAVEASVGRAYGVPYKRCCLLLQVNHGVLRVRGNSQKHNPYVLLMLHAAIDGCGCALDGSSRLGSLTAVDSSFILFSVCAADFHQLSSLMKNVAMDVVEGGGIVRGIHNHGIRELVSSILATVIL